MSLRRRNSIATSVILPRHLTLPTNHHLSSSFSAAAAATSSSSSSTTTSSSAADFDLVPTRPISLSYTSLKDIIPGGLAAAQSPTAATPAGSEISIRNRLVKQAAWAYLQPMSTSPDSAAGDHLLRRIAARVLGSPFFSLLRAVARAFCICFL